MTVSQDAPLRYDLGGYKSIANGRITVNLTGPVPAACSISSFDSRGGAARRTRTPDQEFRKLLLCPPEL